ncbi:MAG: type II toxin-antitoxin system RelE/ParE family toxin [Candidatus Sulfotelmatobacter sp.]
MMTSAQDCEAVSVSGYVIIYRIENQDVLILHVVHGRRDIQALL